MDDRIIKVYLFFYYLKISVMKLQRPLITFSLFTYFIFVAVLSSAQDTTRYCQENAVLFSNCYEFVRTTKGLNYGTFTERTSTNDGQVFYGWGTFKETKSSIELTYSKINTYPVIK